MFESARRKTASATNIRPSAVNTGTMNHWAWTGWMPEDGHELAQPSAQFIEELPVLMAA